MIGLQWHQEQYDTIDTTDLVGGHAQASEECRAAEPIQLAPPSLHAAIPGVGASQPPRLPLARLQTEWP